MWPIKQERPVVSGFFRVLFTSFYSSLERFLLQVTEALVYLHYSCKVIHHNIAPQSILINKKGTWKLAGLEFVEKCHDNDLLVCF